MLPLLLLLGLRPQPKPLHYAPHLRRRSARVEVYGADDGLDSCRQGDLGHDALLRGIAVHEAVDAVPPPDHVEILI